MLSICQPNHEIILNSIVAGLVLEGRVPAGSFLDAGANTGEWACLYASLVPDRVVHALDPSRRNVALMKQRYVTLRPNMRPRFAGLGGSQRWVDAGPRKNFWRAQLEHVHRWPSASAYNDTRTTFQILTIDELFASERLGFMHLDVEGSELDVLRGGTEVLVRDRPVFTVELHVEQDANYTRALLELIDLNRYDAFLVDEHCGMRRDCRNLICLPRPPHNSPDKVSRFAGSATLNLAVAARSLFAVNVDSVPKLTLRLNRLRGELSDYMQQSHFVWPGKAV